MLFENILLVCVGNICRSPMAEGLFRQAFKDVEKKCRISSAGLSALVGSQPDPIACELLLQKNIDISNYIARQLNTELIHDANLILVMESGHKARIEEFEPSAKGKVFRLGHWGDFDIPDPFNKNAAAFQFALNKIERGIADWLPKII
jgi:protein-tyrosine phosphatase